MGSVSAIPGLTDLWRLSRGDDRIGVAVVDGTVDTGHPAFAGNHMTRVQGVWPGEGTDGAKAAHGTAVASVLFGHHQGPVPGVAPGCRAVSVPAFSDHRPRMSQLELARGIELALDEGVHVINVSGGQLAPVEEAEDPLVRVIRRCADANVLVVAAAGNDGCFCDHVPAALPSVLAVGALDEAGRPLASSNWGPGNSRQGILAPGQNIPVAVPGGGTAHQSGTSLAAPLVAGVAALLLSLQLRDGRKPDPSAVRDILLNSADPCDLGDADACARYLTGALNITKAVNAVTTNATDTPPTHSREEPVSLSCEAPAATGEPVLSGCDCGCDAGADVPAPVTVPAEVRQSAPEPAPAPPTSGVVTSGEESPGQPVTSSKQRLVYALGTLGYDFGTEARRDTYKQLMPVVEQDGRSMPANPYDPQRMVDYLKANPSEASPLIWTLNLDLTPVYAIEAVGGYAAGVYERLVGFLSQQLLGEDEAEFIDRISVPGRLPGRTARLFSGQVVPVVEVDLTRGLYGWSVSSLSNYVANMGSGTKKDAPTAENLKAAVSDFLTRVYYDLRNFGATSRDRALNFAATNAVQARDTLTQALSNGMALQDIDVEKSPFARPDSNCWDVKLRFFDPDNSRRAKRVYRFTIDVKDVMPVTVGSVRSWPES
jgi:cyanobactin maturation PatA/PatG family protease